MRPLLLPALLALPVLAGCTVDRSYQTQTTPQRPTFSSDTNTTAAGTIELEAGLDLDPGDRLSTPTTVKYGVDERTELSIGFEPYTWIDIDDRSPAGIGDLVPVLRRRLVDQDGSSPSLGYLVGAKLPTASPDKGIGTGETDLFLASIAHWSDPAWTATGYYQLGLLGAAGSSGMDLSHLMTVSGSRPVQSDLSAFGELAFRWTPEQDLEELFGIAGIALTYRPGLVFDLGARLGLSPDAEDFALLIGTTINFGRQGWRLRP